jgi:hypothetical protein
VETSGRADYDGTRRFYERHGYRATARIPDFYAPGDDQVVYVKPLQGSPLSQSQDRAPQDRASPNA